MNICYLEDSGSALLLQNFLQDIKGHDIHSTDDYRDLAEWIFTDPNRFDVLLLDLMLPIRSLLFVPGCERYNNEKHLSPTLYFIDKFIMARYPHLAEKIILISAYFDVYMRGDKGNRLDNYRLIDKNDPDFIEQLVFMIDAIEK
jgi:hypothetical protein